MAAKKQTPMDFIVARLKKNPDIEYAKLKQAADKKKLAIFPIMFGRAKLMLGLTKPKKKKRAASKKPARATHTSGKAGRGRPRSAGASKSARVRELLESGMSTAQIVKRVGCSPNLVYVVKSNSGGKPRRNAQPTTRGTTLDVDAALRSFKELEAERDRLRATVEKVNRILAG